MEPAPPPPPPYETEAHGHLSQDLEAQVPLIASPPHGSVCPTCHHTEPATIPTVSSQQPSLPSANTYEELAAGYKAKRKESTFPKTPLDRLALVGGLAVFSALLSSVPFFLLYGLVIGKSWAMVLGWLLCGVFVLGGLAWYIVTGFEDPA